MSYPSTLGMSNTASNRRPQAGWLRWSAVSLLLLLGLVGAVLAWRALAGALGQPLPSANLATAGILLAGTAAAVRWLWRRERGASPARRLNRLAISFCPTVFLVLIAASLSVRGTSPAGLAWLWSVLALEEITTGLSALRRRRKMRRLGRQELQVDSPRIAVFTRDVAHAKAAKMSAGHAVDATMADPAPLASLPQTMPEDEVTQQLVRRHTAEGGDVLAGWSRVAIPTGGRTASLHVAFCPPFTQTPSIEVEQESGPPCRIKIVQSLPYGARLDIKLNHPIDSPDNVLLRFVATLA